MFVDVDGELVEIPRLLKRDGARLTVTTEDGLRAALAAGWVLRVGQRTVRVETDGDVGNATTQPDATLEVDTADVGDLGAVIGSDELPDVADVPEPDAPRRGGKGGKKR